ncbi:hypothetical protein [Paraclostridium bifermentans]|uniref:hypothetical protein n=1 Tax=Paraclostridium bifermentans TaxID=1490 RepID=UPI00374EA8E1
MSNAKYCFLNRILSVGGNTTHCQIIINEPNSLKITEKTIPLNDLYDYYNDEYITDFSIDENGTLQCDTEVNIKEVSQLLVTTLIKQDTVVKPGTTNIYDLFLDIVDCEGLYVDESVEGLLGTENMESGVIKFLPKFSSNTMTVSLAINLNDGWKTRKLIYEKEGIIQMDEFYFMIDSKYENRFRDYEIEKVTQINYLNKPRVLYKVTEDIGVFAYTALGLKLYSKLIRKYQSISELSQMLIGSANYLINTAEEKEPIKSKPKTSVSRYNNYYVKFKPYYPSLTKKDRDYFYNMIYKELIPAINEGANYTQIMEYLQNINFTKPQVENIRYMLMTIVSTLDADANSSDSNLLLQCRNDVAYYTKEKFKADNFLYAIRSCLFTFNIDPKELEGLEDYIIFCRNENLD